MASVLPAEKKIAVISSLCEGSSIRSIERVTDVRRDTIMRLGVKVGHGCTKLVDRKMRNLETTRLEMDEIWGYIGKRDKHVRPGDDPQFGNLWTFCAIDADAKLVPAFHVASNRSEAAARVFVSDVAGWMKNRVQISTDGLSAYVAAIEQAYVAHNVDYGQIIKTYGTEESIEQQRRYSALKITECQKKGIFGYPDWDFISTSYVERLNATTRLHMKRLARLTHVSARSGRTSKRRSVCTSPITASCGVTIRSAARLLVKETFQGQTIWDGVVEVFHLKGPSEDEPDLCVDARCRRSRASEATPSCMFRP